MTGTDVGAGRRLLGAFFSTAVSFAFLLFILRSQVAIDYMKKGLELCARTVIPSLFPLMVVSRLAAEGIFGRLMGRLLSRPAKWLLGVSEDSACAYIFGLICGFPIGARILCDAYDKGRISGRELSRAMTFCNNPGAAFVISAVGVSLFGSLRLGVALFVCVIISSLAVGIIMRLILGRERDESPAGAPVEVARSEGGIIAQFTSAVRDSAISMLTVCAYVAFFTTFVGCLGACLEKIGVGDGIITAIFGFFELSSGVGMAAELSPVAAVVISAAALGWSGLSVHFQVMTVTGGKGVAFLPYFAAKAMQGVICAALALALTKLPFLSDQVFAPMGEECGTVGRLNIAAVVLGVFSAAAAVGGLWRLVAKRGGTKATNGNGHR